MISKTALTIAAASAGVAFVGYCIYFDHKRRSDPLFKRKLRERRKRAKEAKAKSASGGSSELPNLNDTEAMQRFFLQEVQLGEELLGQGDVESGVEHLSKAVAVCSQPQQLLQVLQQTLPPQVFQLMLQRLPAVSQQISGGGSSATSPTMAEDDIE